MVLLSHFHSLSSFVFSCGLTQKLDGLSSPKLKAAPVSPLQQEDKTKIANEQISKQESSPPKSSVPSGNSHTPQKTVLSEITINNNILDGNKHAVVYNNNASLAVPINASGPSVNAVPIAHHAVGNGVAKHAGILH